MNWAQVASAPYRLVKAFPTEGGTRALLIARWHGAIPEGRISLDWLRILSEAKPPLPAMPQPGGEAGAKG